MHVAILNAGEQPDYLYGLVSGLAVQEGMRIDVVDADQSIGLFDRFPNVRLNNLRGSQRPSDPMPLKALRIARYYLRLLWFALRSPATVLHVQWDNSLLLFDRAVLPHLYHWCGKRVVFTAHNVYKEERDGRASALREWSLRRQYAAVDRIIVHTDAMKKEICGRFGADPDTVHVIPHGLNMRVTPVGLSRPDARRQLDIPERAKVVLSFGYIDRYKGIDLLVEALDPLATADPDLFLLIAGQPKRDDDFQRAWRDRLAASSLRDRSRLDLRFIAPQEVETYFAAADCLTLPYRAIYQSGLIFLAYRFGVPVVATDVGSFREDIPDGVMGFVADGQTAEAFSKAMERFFTSDLFRKGAAARDDIRMRAESRYNWDDIARRTMEVYTLALASDADQREGGR